MIEAVWYGIIAAFSFLGLLSVLLYILLHIYNTNGIGKVVFYVDKNVPEHRFVDLIFSSYLRNFLFGKMISDEIIVISDSLGDDCINDFINVANELDCLKCVVYKGSLSVTSREENDEKGIVRTSGDR